MCNCSEMTKKFERLDDIIAKHKEERGALIPILHEAQEVFGYLPYDCLLYTSRKKQAGSI